MLQAEGLCVKEPALDLNCKVDTEFCFFRSTNYKRCEMLYKKPIQSSAPGLNREAASLHQSDSDAPDKSGLLRSYCYDGFT